MLVLLSRAQGRSTFFVDPVAGNDSNNGRSASSAWKTTTPADAVTLVNTQRIAMKVSGRWLLYQQLGELVTNTEITADLVTGTADQF